MDVQWFKFVICFSLYKVSANTDFEVLKEYDICSPPAPNYYPSTVYLPIGSSTEFFASGRECSLHFKTCRKCMFRIGYFNNLKDAYQDVILQFKLDGDSGELMMIQRSSSANCWFNCQNCEEQLITPYDTGFDSTSSYLKVRSFCFLNPQFNTSLRFKLSAVEKVQYITQPDSIIKSPFFPQSYRPNNEIYTFQFTAQVGYEYIAIEFADFVVSKCSGFQVLNGTLLGLEDTDSADKCPYTLSCCPYRQRPYIISTGPVMTIKFDTGHNQVRGGYYFYTGFKGRVSFLSEESLIHHKRTDCGGVITDAGGVVNLTGKADGQDRDCVWIIRRYHPFKRVSLRLLQYKKSRRQFSPLHKYSLVVKAGNTSEATTVYNVSPLSFLYDNATYQQNEHISDYGFYIRLRGNYLEEDDLVIVYTSYLLPEEIYKDLDECPDQRYQHLCSNGRCISKHLLCDNYDHCGDFSDENIYNCRGFTTPQVPIEKGETKWGVVIPVISCLFVVVCLILCILFCFIKRCPKVRRTAVPNPRSNRRTQRNNCQNHMNHYDNFEMNFTLGPPSYEDTMHNSPMDTSNMPFPMPIEDNPPTYEQATAPFTQTQNYANILPPYNQQGISHISGHFRSEDGAYQGSHNDALGSSAEILMPISGQPGRTTPPPRYTCSHLPPFPNLTASSTAMSLDTEWSSSSSSADEEDIDSRMEISSTSSESSADEPMCFSDFSLVDRRIQEDRRQDEECFRRFENESEGQPQIDSPEVRHTTSEYQTESVPGVFHVNNIPNTAQIETIPIAVQEETIPNASLANISPINTIPIMYTNPSVVLTDNIPKAIKADKCETIV